MGIQVQWQAIQERIWACEACKGHTRVENNIRQQTPVPKVARALLFVGVAPPEQGAPVVRIVARSATNDPGDNLRQFIESAAALRWEDLTSKGVFLIHAVKCAIVPDKDKFQNPPNDVVDLCCSIGFTDELQLLRPDRIVAFGRAACRAVLRHPSVTAPRGVGISKTFKKLQKSWPQGVPCKLGGDDFTLHPAPFPRSGAAKKNAAVIIREVAGLAGLGNPKE